MVFLNQEDLDRELDALAQTDASWLRLPIDWYMTQSAPGQFDWTITDRLVNAADARGLKVLGIMGPYTPDWAREPGSFYTAPIDPTTFATFAKAAASRYGSRVSHWEIWNEPNLPLFFGYIEDRAARYVELLKAAYAAIKSVKPDSTVIAAGLSPTEGPHAPPAFLSQMYDEGVHGYFDAMAMHPYVFPTGMAADPLNA